MSVNIAHVSCIILAGGQGKRAGGRDKGLVLYHNKPLIKYVIDVIKPQVDDIVISANRNINSYHQFAKQVKHDTDENYHGPLAGIAACLPLCKHDVVLVVACDMPLLPGKLVKRLATGIQGKSACIATINHYHQLAMLIKKNSAVSIQSHLEKNQLKLIQWVKSMPYTSVSFDDIPEAFVNLNHLSETN